MMWEWGWPLLRAAQCGDRTGEATLAAATVRSLHRDQGPWQEALPLEAEFHIFILPGQVGKGEKEFCCYGFHGGRLAQDIIKGGIRTT